MQYITPPPDIPSLKWGCEKEDTARSKYFSRTAQLHATSGLVIHVKYPHLGATSDTCDCCSDGLVEIKCRR